MFTPRPLVLGKRELDIDLERSQEIEFLLAGAHDLQAVLGSNPTLSSRHCESPYHHHVISVVADGKAGVIVATTSVVPHTYRVYSIEALIPVLITYVCHLIWPFVLDPYFTTFTVSPPRSDDGYFRS